MDAKQEETQHELIELKKDIDEKDTVISEITNKFQVPVENRFR